MICFLPNFDGGTNRLWVIKDCIILLHSHIAVASYLGENIGHSLWITTSIQKKQLPTTWSPMFLPTIDANHIYQPLTFSETMTKVKCCNSTGTSQTWSPIGWNHAESEPCNRLKGLIQWMQGTNLQIMNDLLYQVTQNQSEPFQF